jgi:hypothetical protein
LKVTYLIGNAVLNSSLIEGSGLPPIYLIYGENNKKMDKA